MSQLLYHATLKAHLPSIFGQGLVPKFGPFTRAAHEKPCSLHPDPRRIHVVKHHLDEGLLSALCFHVIRVIKFNLKFDDAYIVQNFEPGWLSAKDLAALGAMIEVEVTDDEVHFQEQRDERCTCLENRDRYLTRATPAKRYWAHAPLFAVLNAPATVDQYQTWLKTDYSHKQRMDDGMFLLEFRPDALAQPCPKADGRLAPLRSQYPRSVTEMNLE